MVEALIKREIEYYKKYLVSSDYDELYKWEALKIFQDNWDLDAVDFKTNYDISFNSKISNNLWANPHWFPKSAMLRLIEHDQERVRNMFRDLYNEADDIDKRIDRFVYHCDDLTKQISAHDNGFKNHFHDGQRMVSMYLAFRFPKKYAIYKYTEFKTFMKIVRAVTIPSTGEYERFFKVVRLLYDKYLRTDTNLMDLHNHLLTDKCFKEETLMLAQDFIFTTARRYLP